MKAFRRSLAVVFFIGFAGSLFAQAAGGLGMEPTPQNFNNSIRSGTAKAGQREDAAQGGSFPRSSPPPATRASRTAASPGPRPTR